MNATALTQCTGCGWHGRPRRIWCPKCEGDAWVVCDVAFGEVVAVTAVHRANGAVLDPPARMARVAMPGSGAILCALEDDVAVGDQVQVTPLGAAFVARRQPSGS
jgi:uncharacterized OB-fold protein